jgi:hypothetical protein
MTPRAQEILKSALGDDLEESFIKKLICLPDEQMEKAYMQYREGDRKTA